jgi:hypothetical protein
LECLCQIAEKVEPIRYLNSLRRTLASTLGIRPRAIAADDLDGGMSSQPFANVSDSRSGSRIDGLPPFQIHQHRPILMTAAPSPIVDAENFDITSGSIRCSLADDSQNCVGARANSQLGCQATTGFPTQRVPDG